jgi:hypothetical protein
MEPKPPRSYSLALRDTAFFFFFGAAARRWHVFNERSILEARHDTRLYRDIALCFSPQVDTKRRCPLRLLRGLR